MRPANQARSAYHLCLCGAFSHARVREGGAAVKTGLGTSACYGVFALFLGLCSVLRAESLGNLAQYPPERKALTITTAPDGMPVLQPEELSLDSGQYYRLKIHCPDVQGDLTGWRIEMAELLNNAHLRLVTVGDIEIHLQG